MIQFLADNIDQLDLALDQLAISDRNFDRFALMLIDNVVELTLHRFGQDRASENKMWGIDQKPKHDPKTIKMAIGQNFDKKAKAAYRLNLFDKKNLESILCLHSFRNTSYHKGLRHEGILHSLSLFYFVNACEILKNYKPAYWSWGSNDKISHRARKYIGEPGFSDHKNVFRNAYERLKSVAESMGDSLISDLANDMEVTIDDTDSTIDFLSSGGPEKRSRNEVVVDTQVWPFIFTDEAKKYLKEHNCEEKNFHLCVEWLSKNYPWPLKTDPIDSWKRRLNKIIKEKNRHNALKMYCDFMKQTEAIRTQLNESAAQLDLHIQQQIDMMRGK